MPLWVKHLIPLCLVALAGCRPADQTPSARRPAGNAVTTPLDVVRDVHRLRRDARWDQLSALIDPAQRQELIRLLQAIDRVHRADQALHAVLLRYYGPATADRFHRAQVINAVGVFSWDVEVIHQQVHETQAVVTIQVAGRVPLDEVNLIREGDRWLIRTDPPIEGVPEALRDLAAVLERVARQVERDQPPVERLEKELAAQEAPVLRRIESLLAKAPG